MLRTTHWSRWTPDQLTEAMIGIGMLFVGEGDDDAPIETTLLAASFEGIECRSGRVLGVLTT